MILLEKHECLNLLESNVNDVICLMKDLPVHLTFYDRKEDMLAYLSRQKDFINELRESCHD